MSDSEFVLWYVNKHYLFTGLKFKYKYHIKDNHITFGQLCDNVSNSTAINKIEDKTLHGFLLKWYNNKQIEAKLDALDFIKYKYKVTLGPRSWEIAKLSGKLVKKDDIVKDLNKKYDSDFIINLIDEWFDTEMIRITETSTLHFK
jgi:hypothetical protein